MLPVCEEAVSSRQNRAQFGFPQSQHEAADARVGTAAEQVGHLHPCGERTIQVLHKVPDGYVDVGAVADHQSVDQHPVETVVGQPAKLRPRWSGVPIGAAFEFWTRKSRQTVLLQHLLEENFEKLSKSQPHLKIKQ